MLLQQPSKLLSSNMFSSDNVYTKHLVLTSYRVELSVYDNDEQCTFIILGDAGKDLTGRKATELIDAYVQVMVVLMINVNFYSLDTYFNHNVFEVDDCVLLYQENGGVAAELEVPVPQCFIDTIGQTKKFRIKVTDYNFTSTKLSFTATKIVSAAELPPKNPPLQTPPVTEVENTELAESSGGGPSAIEDQKEAKRTKRSGQITCRTGTPSVAGTDCPVRMIL